MPDFVWIVTLLQSEMFGILCSRLYLCLDVMTDISVFPCFLFFNVLTYHFGSHCFCFTSTEIKIVLAGILVPYDTNVQINK